VAMRVAAVARRALTDTDLAPAREA
jgi:hypothetical protein